MTWVRERRSVQSAGRYLRWLVLLLASMPALAFAREGADTASAGGGALSVGAVHNCLLDREARPVCWGDFDRDAAALSDQRAASVVAGWGGFCLLRADGEAVCRGGFAATAIAVPPGPWRALAMGRDAVCGLRHNGQLQCWGHTNEIDPFAPLAPTEGHYRAIAMGGDAACAIRDDGGLRCWSRPPAQSIEAVPEGHFLQVSVGYAHACALRVDGSVVCWGSNGDGQTVAPQEPGFIAVAAGLLHTCALRIDGSVRCWGLNDDGQSTPPAGAFTALTAYQYQTCGRRIDGSVACWGNQVEAYRGIESVPHDDAQIAIGGGEVCALDPEGTSRCYVGVAAVRPPLARWRQLSLGTGGGCGIRRDGRTVCWGAAPSPPALDFRTIALGDAHACGLKNDRTLACWGADDAGQASAPSGEFLGIGAGTGFACALAPDGAIACWGGGRAVADAPTANGFSDLVVHGVNACARKADFTWQCWGADIAWFDPRFQLPSERLALGAHYVCTIPHAGGPPDLECRGDFARGVPVLNGPGFTAFTAAGDIACGLRPQDGVVCRGAFDQAAELPQLRVGVGRVGSGAAQTCSLGGDGLVTCIGDDTLGQRQAPAAHARALAVEQDHACLIDGEGRVRCWGDDARGASSPPVDARARALDLGQHNGCLLQGDGTVVCWGWNINGQGTPPAGAFRDVATGLNHSCGIRDDGTLSCWGYGADGQTAAPAGHFLAVDVGERHACAIAIEGDLRCWGLGSEGQTAPPPGRFRALASGAFHNCAIRDDGIVACWGRNLDGQAIAPDAGRYVDVSAGTAHSCAIAADGMRVCWGAGDRGQAPILGLLPDTLPGARAGEPYEVAFALRDFSRAGQPPRSPRYRVVSGALPDGLALTADGRLHGTPWSTAVGVAAFGIEARDEHGFGATRLLRLTIAPPPDTSPPNIAATLTGTLGDEAWYRSDVRIRWTLGVAEIDIVESSGCEARIVVEDTAAGEVRCTARTAGGERSVVARFKRDATSPVLIATMPPAIVRLNATHDFALSASDATSGLAAAACTPFDTATVGTRIARCEARDRAGNTTVRTAEYRVVVRLPRTGGPQPMVEPPPPAPARAAPLPRAPAGLRRGQRR